MHELALSRAIVEAACAHAEGRRVRSVAVSVGALRQVVPDSLEFNFSLVSAGTLCDGAELAMTHVPARLSCPCGNSWILKEPIFLCPRCGGGRAAVVDGDQLSVDYIEVETPETGEQCTGPR